MTEDIISESQGFSVKKKVDETWKNTIELEKNTADTQKQKPKSENREEAKESEFSYFLTNLGMQAFAALGEIPDPITGAPREDLRQARYLVDTLELLHQKTQGNLSPEEVSVFEDLLYQLRLKFVQKSKS